MNDKEDSEKNAGLGGQYLNIQCGGLQPDERDFEELPDKEGDFFQNPTRSVREEGSCGCNTADSLVCGALGIARYKLFYQNF